MLKPEHVQRTEDSIRRLGGKAVFVGRFTAALPALVPGMAGMARMPYRTFLPCNAPGGTTWATAFVVLGYLAGSQYPLIERYANYAGIALLAAIAVVAVIRYRNGRAATARRPSPDRAH